MNLLFRMQQSVELFQNKQIRFALAGGMVASLYRNQPRATADIDFAVWLHDDATAKDILNALGLEAHRLRKAQLEGGPAFAIKRENTPVYMLCGRSPGAEIGVDLILLSVPWVNSALDRAQANAVDFGFGGVPCITAEDLVLSKLYALNNQPTRFMDLDDIRSILEAQSELDWIYLRDQAKHLGLSIPDAIKQWFPIK
jgi:hypothetical protein